MNHRLEKLDKLRKSNVEAYPRDFPNRDSINKVLTEFNVAQNLKEFEKISNNKYRIAGRIESRRDHGNNIFFDIFDQTGSIQLHAKNPTNDIRNRQKELKDTTGFGGSMIDPDPSYWEAIQECDLGDCVGIEGTLSQNPRGEPLLLISNWTLLAKALIEPPDKHNGITEPEVKYRHRERDLLSSADSRALFKTRAEIIFEIRKYLNERDFVEIETPILQSVYGGATAKPFVTTHKSLGQNFYLSISSELFLKRALVGGFDRVYSVSRCFRNEGISPEHNPEFTNLEIFETCSTWNDVRFLTEDILNHLFNIFNVHRPTFHIETGFSKSAWPLSRNNESTNKDGKFFAEAWELYINNMEIASGASDLNDPFEQKKRFLEVGPTNYDHYNPYDKNYIEALEMGALPWAGVGIGIDRLTMLLTGKTNIRDVLLFPTLRQNSADD